MNDFKKMTFKDFSNYCEQRASDGNWCLQDALICINIVSEISSIKVTGVFNITKKKATEKAQEEAWLECLKEMV